MVSPLRKTRMMGMSVPKPPANAPLTKMAQMIEMITSGRYGYKNRQARQKYALVLSFRGRSELMRVTPSGRYSYRTQRRVSITFVGPTKKVPGGKGVSPMLTVFADERRQHGPDAHATSE